MVLTLHICMNILSRFFSKLWPKLSVSNTSAIAEYLGIQQSASGVRVTPEIALSNPAVAAAVRLIANQLGVLDLNCYSIGEYGSRDVAVNHFGHWLTAVEPSPYLTPFTWKSTIVFHALLWGRGCTWIRRDQFNKPMEFFILPPEETTLEIQSGVAPYWTTTIDAERYEIPYEDVIALKGFSKDGLTAFLPHVIFRNALSEGITYAKYSGAFFRNSARPSVVVETNVNNDAKKEAFSDKLRQWYSTVDDSFKPFFVTTGTKITPLTMDNEASKLLELREHGLVTIANLIGVPASFVGSGVNTSYKSLSQDSLNLLTYYLNPWLVQLEQLCNKHLLSENQKYRTTHYFQFDRSKLLEADQETTNKIWLDRLDRGLVSWEETRNKFNLPTRKVDDQEWRHLSNVTIEGEEPEPQPVAQAQPEQPQEEPQAEEPTEDQADEVDVRSLTRQTVERIFSRLAKSPKDLDFHSEILGEILAPYAKGEEWLANLYSEIREEYSQVLPEQRAEVIGRLDIDTWTERLL